MANSHEDTFWIVWNPRGRNPEIRHSMFEKACAEAKRLAHANPGQDFIVLEARTSFKLVNVVQTDYDMVPF